jgi:transposase
LKVIESSREAVLDWLKYSVPRCMVAAPMDTNVLFAAALQLTAPWRVVESRFEKETGELRIRLDFNPGSHFPCPQCGSNCPVHDTKEKSWRHLNFWQYRTELTARTPRIECPEHKVLLIEVPWARADSGFTLMMEAFIMLLSQQMPVSDVAEMLDEHDTRIWRVVGHYVDQAQQGRNWKEVRRILVDETSARRGHRYVTNIVDALTHDLLMMVEGRSSDALKEFARELKAHEATSEQIEWIGMDMSPAYIKGAAENFPKAKVVFDRFHVMQLAGHAVDSVRKELQREGAELKGQRWALLGNEWTRSQEQQMARRELCNLYPKLGRAIGLRDMLQDVLEDGDEASLKWWCARAGRSRLDPFKKVAKTLRDHWDGLTAYFESGITSGAIEAVNGCIQLAKRLARGFRNFHYFRWMAYLKAGGLHLELPSLSPT